MNWKLNSIKGPTTNAFGLPSEKFFMKVFLKGSFKRKKGEKKISVKNFLKGTV